MITNEPASATSLARSTKVSDLVATRTVTRSPSAPPSTSRVNRWASAVVLSSPPSPAATTEPASTPRPSSRTELSPTVACADGTAIAARTVPISRTPGATSAGRVPDGARMIASTGNSWRTDAWVLLCTLAAPTCNVTIKPTPSISDAQTAAARAGLRTVFAAASRRLGRPGGSSPTTTRNTGGR